MKKMFAFVVLALLIGQTRQTLQAQSDNRNGWKNDPEAFLNSKDTIWIQLCDKTAERFFFKKLRIGRDSQWFAGLFVEDKASTLWQQKNGHWTKIEKISRETPMYINIMDCELEYPNLNVFDFNEDGHEDLQIQLSTNMNGNIWSSTYLYDTVKQTLRLIEGLYDVPNVLFDQKTGIIWNETSRSTFGVGGFAFYQLRNFRAYPLKKVEEDYTSANVGIETMRLYKGKGRRWKRVRTTIMDEDIENVFLKAYERIYR